MRNATTGTAVLAMLIGMFMFSVNDAMGKWLMGTYPVGQLLFLRSVAAVLILLPLIARRDISAIWKVERPGLQLLRAVLATFEVFAFYLAVSYLPLADVMTFWLAAPIYVAALSPLLLGEHVGWRRWSAIGVGFLGVIVALKPSEAMFSIPSVVSIVGTFAFSIMLVLSRSLRATNSEVLVFWQMTGGVIAGLALIPFMWTPPSMLDAGWMGLLGVIGMSAHVLMTYALKIAPAATVTPLQYSQLFWAAVLGWFVFHEAPSVNIVVGAVLIVASGLYIFFRERKLGKKSQPAPSVPELP